MGELNFERGDAVVFIPKARTCPWHKKWIELNGDQVCWIIKEPMSNGNGALLAKIDGTEAIWNEQDGPEVARHWLRKDEFFTAAYKANRKCEQNHSKSATS